MERWHRGARTPESQVKLCALIVWPKRSTHRQVARSVPLGSWFLLYSRCCQNKTYVDILFDTSSKTCVQSLRWERGLFFFLNDDFFVCVEDVDVVNPPQMLPAT